MPFDPLPAADPDTPGTDAQDQPSGPQSGIPAERGRPTPAGRVVALLEILLCSDYPTQLMLGAMLAALGFRAQAPGGGLDLTYVVILSLTDSLVLVLLIVFFLAAHDESFRDLLFGGRPIARELAVGLPMALTSLVIAIAVLASIQHFAPSLHTVERNPLQDLMRTPRDVLIFAVVVVVAGGVREEIQRAFILRRFEGWLGGGRVGVLIASVAFGAGHLVQGTDAAIATGILGAFWGVVYLRRRSVVAPVVSHSGFNLLQIAQALAIGR